MKLPKTYFGWSNLKWLITELIKMYSSGESYFSKKRIESGVAFIVMQWGMILYLQRKYTTMDMYDLIMWAGVEAVLCGYQLSMIERAKKPETPKDDKEDAKV